MRSKGRNNFILAMLLYTDYQCQFKWLKVPIPMKKPLLSKSWKYIIYIYIQYIMCIICIIVYNPPGDSRHLYFFNFNLLSTLVHSSSCPHDSAKRPLRLETASGRGFECGRVFAPWRCAKSPQQWRHSSFASATCPCAILVLLHSFHDVPSFDFSWWAVAATIWCTTSGHDPRTAHGHEEKG